MSKPVRSSTGAVGALGLAAVMALSACSTSDSGDGIATANTTTTIGTEVAEPTPDKELSEGAETGDAADGTEGGVIQTEADGTDTTGPLTVTLTIDSVDDAPIATAQTVNATEDQIFTGTLATGDTPSGDGGNLYALGTDAANGSVTVTNAATGAFTYTPNANFNGEYFFLLSICFIEFGGVEVS